MTRKALPTHRTVLFGLLLALALAGCGHHHDDGFIVVDNRTDLTTNEALLTFHVAPFGLPFSGDLLGGDLLPLESRFIGVFAEDYYDAQGELELGQLIEWFDTFVGNDDTTVFEVR
jgi:hypothetical protein